MPTQNTKFWMVFAPQEIERRHAYNTSTIKQRFWNTKQNPDAKNED